MLFASWEVRIVKNCDQGLLENAALGLQPQAAFSSPRSQFFTIRTNPKLVNNLFIFSQAPKQKKKLTENNSCKRYCDRDKNQSDRSERYKLQPYLATEILTKVTNCVKLK